MTSNHAQNSMPRKMYFNAMTYKIKFQQLEHKKQRKKNKSENNLLK